MRFIHGVGGCLITAALLWTLPVPAGAATHALYGLVIGMDLYDLPGNNLEGAVNDAKDIAQALRKAGVKEMKFFSDHEATRDNIQNAWFDLVGKAKPGDTLVFSYAGHGAQEPEPPGWNEPNGKVSVFILSGYQPSGAGTRERIPSFEMYQWLKAADDKGINVVFVADSCFSGRAYRSLGKSVRYRTARFADPELKGDLLKLPDPALENLNQNLFRNVTFIGATQPDKLDPEVTIDGEARGALSWAFSRALEGAADKDGDGQISQQELLTYLVPTVEVQAENQQIPSILPLRADARPILPAARGIVGKPPDKPDAVLVKLLVQGDAPANLPRMPGLALTDDERQADLIWNRASRTVDHRIGGRVAEGIDEHGILAVLSKWTALAFIKSATAVDPVALSITSGNQVHNRGETLEVQMTGARFPYLTMFNLPPDGKVEFFYPENDREKGTDWRGKSFSLQLRVQNPPFGAEHLVAVLTEQPATALQEALKGMGSADRATGLSAMFSTVFQGQSFQAGVVGIYTKGGG